MGQFQVDGLTRDEEMAAVKAALENQAKTFETLVQAGKILVQVVVVLAVISAAWNMYSKISDARDVITHSNVQVRKANILCILFTISKQITWEGNMGLFSDASQIRWHYECTVVSNSGHARFI